MNIDLSKYKDDELVTLREAAAILNVAESTFARYRDAGRIPYLKYSNRKFLYKVSDLKKFLVCSYVAPCDFEE